MDEWGVSVGLVVLAKRGRQKGDKTIVDQSNHTNLAYPPQPLTETSDTEYEI